MRTSDTPFAPPDSHPPHPLTDPNDVDFSPYDLPNHLMAKNAAAQARLQRSILRVGRVLRGQVVEAFGDRAFLVRVGKHRFSLQADIDLAIGQNFYFRVDRGRTKDELQLTILAEPGLTEFRLQDALRMVLCADRPVGAVLIELLGQLEQLEPELTAAERDASGKLRQDLADHVLEPGSDGVDLGDVLARSGLGYEATLLRLGLFEGNEPEFDWVGVDHDLKAELLAGLAKLGAGPLADELHAALAALEAEQILQVARQAEGDPNHWTFPVRDGDELTLASLFVQHREVTEFDPLSTPKWRATFAATFHSTGPVRVDLTMGAGGVTLRVLVTNKQLVPVLQERAKKLQHVLADIVDVGVAAEFLPARVTVFPATAEDVDVSRRHLDIAFLRDRKVLDLRG